MNPAAMTFEPSHAEPATQMPGRRMNAWLATLLAYLAAALFPVVMMMAAVGANPLPDNSEGVGFLYALTAVGAISGAVAGAGVFLVMAALHALVGRDRLLVLMTALAGAMHGRWRHSRKFGESPDAPLVRWSGFAGVTGFCLAGLAAWLVRRFT